MRVHHPYHENSVETLNVDFFNLSPLAVARRLIGCAVVRVLAGERLSGRIVEAEAYGGLRDPSCHLVRRDERIWALLSGPPGVLYLHRAYRHWLLNITCDALGEPACVLIRALEPTSGQERMRQLRRGARDLTNGPARLVEALAIDFAWEASPLPRAEFWLEAGEPVPEEQVLNTVRIGLTRGKDLPWRFAVRDNPWVSRSVEAVLSEAPLSPGL
ncbi:DNA-3-methyladenine glycosylase [Gloeobacter morelensis]|uniref:Putative 3-methyladenine DNA glycosylase n=1 Tax=Gloeobacter morelensis MG652769 TaxID=2781736 RepID=A0ABY3PRP2_9CYAN|nr:DNA-3-methyladenine glycosylase [Gloeobacter morelensis]UFP96267.1 DNA-3-methyladenine glycosylase [Gloeobacter morelensis MG652769]